MTTIRDPRALIERARAARADAGTAARILPLIDLTSLRFDETEAEIETLCRRALDAGTAAVCVPARSLRAARAVLGRGPVRLATVANFPDGGEDIARAAEATMAAVADGADEIDVVAPIAAILEGDLGLVGELVEACRKAGGERTTLKLILETGKLVDPDRITAAARAAVMAGIDFLKTSTGKVTPGATLEAAVVMLAVSAEADGRVGFKAAGGVRTANEAAGYLALADMILGSGWADPTRFRIGASALLDDVLRRLETRDDGDDDDDDGGY